MAYKSGADGVTKSGKTKGKNLGDTGPNIGIEGGKGKSGVSQPTSMDMKKVGRNMARANNQSKGR
jgi:hypothetical protein